MGGLEAVLVSKIFLVVGAAVVFLAGAIVPRVLGTLIVDRWIKKPAVPDGSIAWVFNPQLLQEFQKELSDMVRSHHEILDILKKEDPNTAVLRIYGRDTVALEQTLSRIEKKLDSMRN